mgnify:CR=1 FL=1
MAKFLELLERPIRNVDLTEDIGNDAAVNEIRAKLEDDRIYKFTLNASSQRFDVLDKSLEWEGVNSVVEVYKLPKGLKWPTMFCRKQDETGFVFPEFIIRRTNNLHRHRVEATIHRLWDSKHVERILWVGSSDCGKTISANEIIMESILMLRKHGSNNPQARRVFYFRNGNKLFKFYFDAKSGKVKFDVQKFPTTDLLVYHLNDDYKTNRNSFVIYEMDELEDAPKLSIPFLLSTSCRDLVTLLKETFKSEHATYLYDPMLDFEFKFFLDVCFAFGDSTNVLLPKQECIRRFSEQGGVLRKIFSLDYEDPVTALLRDSTTDQRRALAELARSEPKNVNRIVNSIVGVQFNFSSKFKDKDFKAFAWILSKRYPNFFNDVSGNRVVWEYWHRDRNWMVTILSDHIAVALRTHFTFPLNNITYNTSMALFQIQELMHVYGGILTSPADNYLLPDKYRIKSWEFYKCTKKVFEAAASSQKASKTQAKHVSLLYAKLLSDNERSALIESFPTTSTIWRFQGQYLKVPFAQLSTDYVYRSSVPNGPVFDALTAKPASKQLFLFQSTLMDPLAHPIKITPFIKVLSNMQVTDPSLIEDIYFFMITSAHSDIKSQHFFSFQLASTFNLNACYLQVYASAEGQAALRKILFVNPSCFDISSVGMTEGEKKQITKKEMAILSTIERFKRDESIYRFGLPQQSFDNLFTFLSFASKIRPYVCRAAF